MQSSPPDPPDPPDAPDPSDPPVPGLDELLAESPYGGARFLGRGAMGAVYSVEHRFLGRRFALKLLHRRFASDAQYVDRVRIEAQALARLEHPNVVNVVDFWIDKGGHPCVVMELLTGRTLGEELRLRKRLPVSEAVSFARQALSGLSAAHELGVVHRDVKPENLFLHEAPGQNRILKILDFGIARVLPNMARAPVPLSVPTAANAIVGSPRFLSPEAERGERVDARADLFSMGLVLYTMLAGRGPFDDGCTSSAPLTSIANDPVSSHLDAVIRKAIELRPEDRYPSAAEFLRVLRRALALTNDRPRGE